MDSGVLPRHAYTAAEMVSGFKVLDCRIRHQHDWSKCFYAHPQERARRRSLQKYRYAAVLCPDMISRGTCRHGDACGKSHSVFEFWLHPDKYCTRMCYDGAQCKRSFCFFAHVPEELRNVSSSSSDMCVRLKSSTAKPQHLQQQQGLQAEGSAAQSAAQGAAAAADKCTSNSWQACALPDSLASSDSLHDEAVPPKRSQVPNFAGGGSNASAASSRRSASSGSDGGCGCGPSVTAAGSPADAGWSSVPALLPCLFLDARVGQVPGAAAAGGAHDAPAGTQGPGCTVQQHLPARHGTGTSSISITGLGAAAGPGREHSHWQPAQNWQPAAATALAAAFGSSMPLAAGADSVPALPAPSGFAQGACVGPGVAGNANSSSNDVVVDSSRVSRQGVTNLTRSTAVGPADSVLDDVTPLGLFGAVQPRTVHKPQQQQPQ
ncbi:hypothetical protein COO60DRAFT_1526512 [Scenedesmus sp. NREL 46B-D3]|nr:hypothetical protein COO60DRAFT_1526512 [Scenedesmus sp. NREL 46B-D3]